MSLEKCKLPIPAILLAGGERGEGLDPKHPSAPKALLPIGSSYMLSYLLQGVRACSQISRIAVVGIKQEETDIPEDAKVNWLPNASSWIENIYSGAQACPDAAYLLYLAADIPLLTASSLSQFLEMCAQGSSDIYYPIISRADLEKHFPNTKRTYGRLREGQFTGGNALLISKRLLFQNRALYEESFAKRKSVWHLARILGFPFLIKLILGRLTLPETEKRVSEIVGGEAKSIILDDPTLFIDVDKRSDLSLVEKVLSRRSRK